jgi:hypothetical protein
MMAAAIAMVQSSGPAPAFFRSPSALRTVMQCSEGQEKITHSLRAHRLLRGRFSDHQLITVTKRFEFSAVTLK